ncbi:GSCOCG00006432001-RA-CDS, partial [Cotesia congregata]
GTIFSKIINSASLIKISTNPGDSNIKSPNIFHHSIMSRLKEDPHLINIININTLGFRPLKFSLDFTEITLCPFADLPAKVSSTDHLSGGQNTIKRSAFGAFSQDLFMSHHLELLQGQSGVFLPQFPQSVDVMRTIMVLDFQLDSGFRVAGLSLDDNSALVHPESLVQVLVDEQSLISDVGRQHRGWEKEESQQTLPNFEHSRTGDCKDQVQPDAAEPTIVPGPNSPAWKSFAQISIIERRISGALLPSAIKVRFATVSFHTLTTTICGS